MEIDNQLRATTIPPPFQILAQFEALLKERRDLLAELIRLDEQFMVYLLGLRDGQKNDDVETAPGEGRTTERPEAT